MWMGRNVYDFIFSCDAYVSPSRFEGLGNAYIAAQLLNKKCLSSNIDASVEINNIFNVEWFLISIKITYQNSLLIY